MTNRTAHRLAFSIALTLVSAGIARADDGSWFQIDAGPIGGVTLLDSHLADYNWDTRPMLQAGAQVVGYYDRYGAGVRVWRAGTTQATGIPGATTVPRVALTSVEAVGEARIARSRGIELWGMAHGGRLHLGYDPERLAIDLGGGAGTVTVDYNAISEWDFGVGMGIRADLTKQLALTLQGENTTFALDTAHRNGAEIVEARERFYVWSFRARVSWRFGPH